MYHIHGMINFMDDLNVRIAHCIHTINLIITFKNVINFMNVHYFFRIAFFLIIAVQRYKILIAAHDVQWCMAYLEVQIKLTPRRFPTVFWCLLIPSFTMISPLYPKSFIYMYNIDPMIKLIVFNCIFLYLIINIFN